MKTPYLSQPNLPATNTATVADAATSVATGSQPAEKSRTKTARSSLLGKLGSISKSAGQHGIALGRQLQQAFAWSCMVSPAVTEPPAPVVTGDPGIQTAPLPAVWTIPDVPIASGLTIKQKQLVGVMRHPENFYNREARKVNQQYGLAFAASVETAATGLASGEITNFDALWQYATNWRVKLAMSNGPGGVLSGRDDFGMRRKSSQENAWTPCTGCYAYVVTRLQENLRTKIGRNTFTSHTHSYRTKNGASPITMTIVMALAPEPAIKTITDSQFAMVHGPGENVARMLVHAQTLATEYMAIDPLQQTQRMKKLGELHWVLVQAMPNRRGSAACSELVVRALALASNNELPPFKRGFVPDLEAIATPCRAFKAIYRDSFERNQDAT